MEKSSQDRPAGVSVKHPVIWETWKNIYSSSASVCVCVAVCMAHVERACVFVGWPGFWEHCSSCAHLASIKAAATLRNATEPRINRSPVDGTVRTDAHAKTTRWTAVLVRPRAHQTFTYLITARCVVSPYQKKKQKKPKTPKKLESHQGRT